MIPVIIPAHNESTVLPRLLKQLDPRAGRLEVIVVANGCTDDTAGVARATGATVIEIDAASKIAALNAGDAVTAVFPRFYVDADVVLSASDLEALAGLLNRDGVFAVAPGLRLDDSRSSAIVRSYYRYWARLPSVKNSLAGRGCIGLSEVGRRRWDRFPDVIADDLFVREQFTATEFVVSDRVTSAVTTPRTLRALVRRKTRGHRGNRELSLQGFVDVSSRSQWLTVLRTDPRSVVDMPTFMLVTLLVRASHRLTVRRGTTDWGGDTSSRS